MKRGYVLDPVTGKPVVEANRILAQYHDHKVEIPSSIQESLDKAKHSGILGSAVSWRDILTPKRILGSDGAQVLNTTTETIMTPDYTFAADSIEVHDVFKYTLMGSISTVITTPGTITFRLRFGGVGGTVLATSGAYAPDPTAAGTTITFMIEYYVVCRAVGATGSLLAMGRMNVLDFDDASATTLKGNLDMGLIPVAVPAPVTVNTTANAALSPTVQFSVGTATTQLTTLIALLESLN